MASTTDPNDPKPKRGRGRPEERLVIDPANAGDGLDKLLRKPVPQQVPQQAPRDAARPKVKGKRTKAK